MDVQSLRIMVLARIAVCLGSLAGMVVLAALGHDASPAMVGCASAFTLAAGSLVGTIGPGKPGDPQNPPA
jgi:hypothetical protein